MVLDDYSWNQMTARKSPKSETNGNASVESNESHKLREDERKERESLVLWRRPLTVIHYFIVELALVIKEYAIR